MFNRSHEKSEGFASKNVKTITFVVMLALFLIFLGPLSVFTIRDRIEESRENRKPELTQSDILDLSLLGYDLAMEDVRQFKGNYSENEYRSSYMIILDDYILTVEQDFGSSVITYCSLLHKDSGDSIDIRANTSKTVSFINAH